MRIEELTKLQDAVATAAGAGWFLSTYDDAVPASVAVAQRGVRSRLHLFIGPEGGWTPQEEETMRRAGLMPVRLTATILRVETAAVAAAAVAAVLLGGAITRGAPATKPD